MELWNDATHWFAQAGFPRRSACLTRAPGPADACFSVRVARDDPIMPLWTLDVDRLDEDPTALARRLQASGRRALGDAARRHRRVRVARAPRSGRKIRRRGALTADR